MKLQSFGVSSKVLFTLRNKSILWLLAIGLLLYGQTLNFSFLHWDDDVHILAHPPLTWANLVLIFTEPYYGLFIPITYFCWGWISLALSWLQLPLHPLPFHALNLLLHLINTIQVYALIRWVGLASPIENENSADPKRSLGVSEFSSGAAWVGALLFLIHPIQISSVAWISGARDLLSAAFGLWAARAYLSSNRLALPTVLYALGIFSKPSLIFLPLGLLVLRPDRARKPIREFLFWGFLGGFVLFWTRAAQSYSIMPVVYWLQRPLIAMDSLGFYLQKIIFPYPLSVDYGRTPGWVLQHHAYLISGAFLWTLTAVFLIFRRSLTPTLKKGLGWSFFLIFPVLGWLPSAQQSISTVADHYLYPAMPGIAICAATLTDWIRKSRQSKLRLCIFGVWGTWLLSLALMTFLRCSIWKSDTTFFESMVKDNPISVNGQIGLGNLASEQGREGEATEHFRKAHTLAPDNATAFANFSMSLERQGKDEEVLREIAPTLEKVAAKNIHLSREVSPYLIRIWDVVAASQMRLNQLEPARKSLCQSLLLDPAYPRTVELWEQLNAVFALNKRSLPGLACP